MKIVFISLCKQLDKLLDNVINKDDIDYILLTKYEYHEMLKELNIPSFNKYKSYKIKIEEL